MQQRGTIPGHADRIVVAELRGCVQFAKWENIDSDWVAADTSMDYLPNKWQVVFAVKVNRSASSLILHS